MTGVDGSAVEDDGTAEVVLRGELEVVGGGALAGYGCGGGGVAVDGEEEAAVGDSAAGKRDEGGRVCVGAGEGEGGRAGTEGGWCEGDGDLAG